MRIKTYAYLALLSLYACAPDKKTADSIYFNGNIISMDDSVKNASVMVVKDGVILEIGGEKLLDEYDCEKENKHDLKSQFVYPGFIDAHCHFYGYAKTLMSCNLVGTKSWNHVLKKLDTFARSNQGLEWISGRGWDQNDWEKKSYPDNTLLNMFYPNTPVILKRIDGHAAICNQKALDMAGINSRTKIEGGEILRIGNRISGVLVDNAVDLVEKVITQPQGKDMISALKKAEKECYSYGLTTLADAGLDLKECLFLDSLGKVNELSVYLYLMLNPTEAGLAHAMKKGISETDKCRIGSFKLYADGALGSRGAKLKRDYCDRKGHSGMLLHNTTYYDSFCRQVYHYTKYQVNTHCIGDSANRLILETYGKYLKQNEDRRWRIEHAQIVDRADIHLFGRYKIIPSVQPTHAGSDAPWVEDRICSDRMSGAYAYRTLLQQNGYLPLGTDFPVEYINPLYTFYSAVFRKNANKTDQPAFLTNESLSFEEALKGMTIWAAKACMLEHRKGSLTPGKDADFVVLDKNLLKAEEKSVLQTKVLACYRMGRLVYAQ